LINDEENHELTFENNSIKKTDETMNDDASVSIFYNEQHRTNSFINPYKHSLLELFGEYSQIRISLHGKNQ